MDRLKVCFVGAGSIARRHITNLHKICVSRNINVSIDAYRGKDEIIDGVETVYINHDEVPSNYDVIFITNPTGMHLESLKLFHNNGTHFFIEKPVVALDQIEEAKTFPLRADSIYYVACPLRYNAVIRWIKNNINVGDVISIRIISSSYLPEWRPGQDYRNTYSAHRELGGGVSIDLIHEWDYLTYLFGWPRKIYSLFGKKSELEINSDDYAIYIADFNDKIAEVHLDYFGRHAIREIQLITKNNTITGDILNNTITILNKKKIIKFNEERNDYQRREIVRFLNVIQGKAPLENGYHHGLSVMELTQGHIGSPPPIGCKRQTE